MVVTYCNVSICARAWFLKLRYAYHYCYANSFLLVRSFNKKLKSEKVEDIKK